VSVVERVRVGLFSLRLVGALAVGAVLTTPVIPLLAVLLRAEKRNARNRSLDGLETVVVFYLRGVLGVIDP
jgi:hypothetical protein